MVCTCPLSMVFQLRLMSGSGPRIWRSEGLCDLGRPYTLLNSSQQLNQILAVKRSQHNENQNCTAVTLYVFMLEMCKLQMKKL